MSGTSMDSIDTVATHFNANQPAIIGTHSHAIPKALRDNVVALCHENADTVQRYAETDVHMGEILADASLALMSQLNLTPHNVAAIGSHGQTVRHAPPGLNRVAFSQQIGDPNVISARTGCQVVADFRRADIANGGQGAPLVPAFHQSAFHDPQHHRVILNIGGIANISSLPPEGVVCGFDTGPGNRLLDDWCQLHHERAFDGNGVWAASGKASKHLLEHLQKHPFFAERGPKSTGRELFNLDWLNEALASSDLSETNLAPADVQATLLELTVDSVASSIERLDGQVEEVYVCGGGAHNGALMSCLRNRLLPVKLDTTEALGIGPDWVEAVAFAWLAMRRINRLPGNVTNVTGACSPSVLGGIYHVTPK